MLAESERPLIYAGGGVINGNAAKAMRHLANAYKIPVATTLMALGASDTTHPLSLHMLGMHGMAFANYAVDDCDFLIAIGDRLDDRVAGVSASRRTGPPGTAKLRPSRRSIA
jgi:acetolactate synthase-1/2/3 large subunit